jgi:uncharacterized membrane protein
MTTTETGLQADRTLVFVAYVLHLVGAIAGVTSIAGLIVNYVQRGHTDEVIDSHHRWMIASFWWGLLWIVIGLLTIVLVVGWVILFLAWLWYIYRHVRGLIALVNGEPLPA